MEKKDKRLEPLDYAPKIDGTESKGGPSFGLLFSAIMFCIALIMVVISGQFLGRKWDAESMHQGYFCLACGVAFAGLGVWRAVTAIRRAIRRRG